MKKCLILGNGKTLCHCNFTNIPRENIEVIGLCLAFRHWDKINWYPDIYVCVDSVVLNNNVDLMEWICKDKCKMYLLSNTIADNPKFVKMLNESPVKDKLMFIEELICHPKSIFKYCNNYCSGTAALLCAMDRHKEIHLCGFDCDYVELIPECEKRDDGTLIIKETPTENPNYYFDDYQRKGDIYNVPNGKTIHLKSWMECKYIIDFIKLMYDVDFDITNYNDKVSISEYFLTKKICDFNLYD